MKFYYCFACKKFFQSDNNICNRCGRGSASAQRKLLRSTPSVNIYQIFVGKKLVGNQRVMKKGV